MKKIAIFASGSGTNAENIIKYFKDNSNIQVSLVLSNKPDAYVLERAKKFQIPTFVFNRIDFYETDTVINKLKEYEIDFIVLAGFLWLVPQNILSIYPNKIVNIHPALLPKYGGKGMYGMNVHRAVKDAGDKESGITIHYVNEKYDEGAIILQERCAINPEDTPEIIAEKVHKLEYEYYPKIIEKVIMDIK